MMESSSSRLISPSNPTALRACLQKNMSIMITSCLFVLFARILDDANCRLEYTSLKRLDGTIYFVTITEINELVHGIRLTKGMDFGWIKRLQIRSYCRM